MIGEIAPLTLTFFGGPVQVCLYHTYENYFRVYLENTSIDLEDMDAEAEAERAYAIIDLQLSQPDTMKHFITLPIVRKDHAFLTAIGRLKSSPIISGTDVLLSDLARRIYCSSQDIYQTCRYMPSDNFLIGSEDIETNNHLQHNFQPSLPEFMCRVLGKLMRTTQSMKCKGLSCLMASMCHFVRCWDNLRSLAMFIIKDEPEVEKFWVTCNLESLSTTSQIKNEQPTLEYTQKYSIKYSYICKAFGVDLRGLDWEEKLVIFKMFVDNIEITCPGTSSRDFNTNGGNKTEKSQYLTIQPPAQLSEWTCSEVKEFPGVILRMKLMAVDGHPTGVTISASVPDKDEELAVCMLIAHPRNLDL